MASSLYVVDSSFKRTQVKVTAGKYLREVLEEACKSRQLNPEQYSLKTQSGKNIDLSQPFRLSGLTAGAKLQLTQASRSPGVVSVALQLPESEGGGRLNDKFPSSTSLWLILRKYEDAVAGSSPSRLNLTQRGVPSNDSGAGRLLYEQPCLHLMGRNLETFVELQKTLAQLGLNGGTALMKLSFKSSGQPLEEAMKEVNDYFTSLGAVSEGTGSDASQADHATHAGASSTVGSIPDAAADNNIAVAGENVGKEPNEDIPMTEGPTAQPVENDVVASSSETAPQPEGESTSNTINGISVYRPPSSSTPAAALQPDDPSVFEPSVDHAKAHQAALQRATQNQRLLSDKELDQQQAERQQKLATVQSVVVRVRYPDQSQIETTVHASETAADLYARVMDTLAAAPEPFELRYTGMKTHETLPNSSTKRLVKDYGFRGKVLVTLVWSPDASVNARQGPSLKEEYRRHATDLKVDLTSQQAAGEQAHRAAMEKPETQKDGGGGGGSSGGKSKLDVEAKMKKFLGFGKK